MSGGVDSATSLRLLKEEGYCAAGITFILCGDNAGKEAEDARKVCSMFSVPHKSLDLRKIFRESVEEYFVRAYEKGETPNPCVLCNRVIKIPYLLSEAGDDGYIATGHYARIVRNGDRYLLKKGKDEKKDQSYVLWQMTQKELSRLILPLGGYTKEEVREIAAEYIPLLSRKKDSQDICFIPDGDYVSFLTDYGIKLPGEGNFLDTDGNVLGRHKGHICYTPGQRRGLGIALGHYMYVLSKKPEDNTVVLGEREKIFKKTVRADRLNIIAADTLEGKNRLTAKIRYGKKEEPCTVYMTGEDEICAEFDEAVPSPAPGQSLVLYDGDTVVGGGIIK